KALALVGLPLAVVVTITTPVIFILSAFMYAFFKNPVPDIEKLEILTPNAQVGDVFAVKVDVNFKRYNSKQPNFVKLFIRKKKIKIEVLDLNVLKERDNAWKS